MRAEIAKLVAQLDEKDATIRERDAALAVMSVRAASLEAQRRADKATIDALSARVASLEAQLAQLGAAAAKAGASDAYHNGPNSPSSSGSMSARQRGKEASDRRAEKGMGKPGRKKGHPGVARTVKPSRTVHHKPGRCGKCGSTDLHETSLRSKQIVDIVEIVVEEVNHVMHGCRCLECGADVEAVNPASLKGTFMGPSLASVAACMWKHGNSIGSIRGMLNDVFKLDVCRATAHKAVVAVADLLTGEDEKIRQKAADVGEPGGLDETIYGHTYRNEPLSDAPAVSDPAREMPGAPGGGAAAGPGPPVARREGPALPTETPPPDPVGGCSDRREVRAWSLVTPSCTVMRLEPSRGAAVLYEHFGDRIGAANTTDGYVVYDGIGVGQRCFAHVLRESKQISWSKKPDDVALHGRLTDLFVRGCELANPGGALADPRARANYEELTASAKGLADAFRKAGHDKFAGTLENAADRLFTFILYPGLDPTNNACERSMRSVVKHRNTRQQCATAGGRARFGILLTCFETWGKQGLSSMDRLLEILGVQPPPEYAQIRMASSRAPRP